MAIATAIFAGAGIAQGLFSGIGQQDAANRANITANSQAGLQHFAAVKANELAYKQAQAQWAWDKAQIAQLRVVESQNAVDQAAYGAKLIENATRNMEINMGALRDRFETEESLRATQVGMAYQYEQMKRQDETTRATAAYMNSINQRALQGRLTTQQMQAESAALQDGIALEAAKDKLGYQMQQLDSIAKGAAAKAKFVTRQGGGVTSKRLAMEAGQELGRLYGQLELRSRDRASKVALLNSKFQNQFASQMAMFALQSENDAEAMRYQQDRMVADTALADQTLRDLTLPTFQLAENQYGREVQSLQLQTDQAFDKANSQYRMKEYLDPMAPIRNPDPIYISPSQQKGPSSAMVLGSSLIAGVKGAISAYDSESNTFH